VLVASAPVPSPLMDRAALLAHKEFMLDKARRNMDRLLASFQLPVTRQQWEHWLDGCLPEFRANMACVAQLRRAGSLRLRARPDLPAPVSRIQPESRKPAESRTEWARNLRNRTGWHGLKTINGVIIVFLIVLHRRTHYVNLGNRASVGGVPRCLLEADFRIADLIHELAHLEELLGDDVTKTWEFTVKGTAAGADGVRISVDRLSVIKEPVRKPPKQATGEDASDEDEAELVVLKSDAECGDEPVVCTDDDSDKDDDDDGSDTSTDGDVGELKKKVAKAFLKLAPHRRLSAKSQPRSVHQQYVADCHRFGMTTTSGYAMEAVISYRCESASNTPDRGTKAVWARGR
jgi:hypothetical protein